MALRDFKELQQEADALSPEQQLELAHYLLAKAKQPHLKPTGDLGEFRGTIQLKIDPLDYQRSIRSEWS